MSTTSNEIIKIAYIWSNAEEDKELCNGIDKILQQLQRQGIIEIWHSGLIKGGSTTDEEKRNHLQDARVVLLLVSSDFQTPGDHESQVTIVMDRYEQELAVMGKNEAVKIIPILLRPTNLEGEPYQQFTPLPRDGGLPFPISDRHWYNRDEALKNVRDGISAVIKNLQTPVLIKSDTTVDMPITDEPQEAERPIPGEQKAINKGPASRKPLIAVELQPITETGVNRPTPIEPNTDSFGIEEASRSAFTGPQTDAQFGAGQAVLKGPITEPPIFTQIDDGQQSSKTNTMSSNIQVKPTIDLGPIKQTPPLYVQVTNKATIGPGPIKQTPSPSILLTPSLWPLAKYLPRSPLRYFALILLLLIILIIYILIRSVAPVVYYKFFAPSATVTITPASESLSYSFSLASVIGTPDSHQNQVQARQLSYTSQPQTQTVSATGAVNILGVQAKGELTFYNGTTISQTIAPNTYIMDTHGVTITNDVAVTIPPAHPPVEGQVTVVAHAVNAGASGNIPALDINQNCCTSDDAIYVENLSSFTGGKDGQNYTYVQQSDIDGAASTLEQALTPATQLSLRKQLHSNEALVTGPVPCTDRVSSDHKAGDKVGHLTVTVVVTCADEAYDKQGAEKMATRLLNQQAAQDPGTGYVLKGSIKTEVTKVTVVDAGKGTVAIQVTAAGLWVYQFDSTLKLRLAKLIAGKTEQEATNLLEQQVGVAKLNGLNIDLYRISNNILPTDPSKITIVIGSP